MEKSIYLSGKDFSALPGEGSEGKQQFKKKKKIKKSEVGGMG